ncbi:MAG: hypothetical protein AB2558_10840 [Candidatus Thiodiazotropha sp.]
MFMKSNCTYLQIVCLLVYFGWVQSSFAEVSVKHLTRDNSVWSIHSSDKSTYHFHTDFERKVIGELAQHVSVGFHMDTSSDSFSWLSIGVPGVIDKDYGGFFYFTGNGKRNSTNYHFAIPHCEISIGCRAVNIPIDSVLLGGTLKELLLNSTSIVVGYKFRSHLIELKQSLIDVKYAYDKLYGTNYAGNSVYINASPFSQLTAKRIDIDILENGEFRIQGREINGSVVSQLDKILGLEPKHYYIENGKSNTLHRYVLPEYGIEFNHRVAANPGLNKFWIRILLRNTDGPYPVVAYSGRLTLNGVTVPNVTRLAQWKKSYQFKKSFLGNSYMGKPNSKIELYRKQKLNLFSLKENEKEEDVELEYVTYEFEE